MKKFLVLITLLATLAGFAYAQAPAAQAPAGQAPAGQAPAQKKEIKDPTEYNSYINAIQQTDPNAKINALEGFLQQYPNSVVKEDALEALMGAYQQAGNIAKVQDTANRVLQANPNNIRALALMAYLARAQAEAGQNSQANAAQALQFGQRGLQALKTLTKPDGMSDADFDKLKTQTAVIFNGAVGFGALQAKDYKTAQQALQEAVTADPNNIQNVYPLAVAFLEDKPMNPTGLFYAARAAALSNNNPDIVKYGRYKYIKYHGGDDGWNELIAQAKGTPAPPAGFTVKPAPTPAEQAATLVQQKPVDKMSFDEIQLVMTSGNQQASDQVWNGLKGKPIAIEGKLIQASPTKLMIAGTYDDIQSNTADIELTMTAAIPAKIMPKVGTMVQFEGTPTTYDPNPFMVHMEKGVLLSKTPPAPAKKTPPRRRKPSQ